MPTYAYACKQCGHRFDIVQSFSDAALSECPECGGTLRKQFGTVGVTFNGSGFYRTDSRAGSGAGSSAGGSGSGAGASAPSSSKSESSSKSAAKPSSAAAGS